MKCGNLSKEMIVEGLKGTGYTIKERLGIGLLMKAQRFHDQEFSVDMVLNTFPFILGDVTKNEILKQGGKVGYKEKGQDGCIMIQPDDYEAPIFI